MCAKNNYRWKFFRAGRLDQVMFRSGHDIANLDQLDQKLWVALSCPTRGVEFDTATLDLIDTDHDRRIRVPELLAAIKWTVQLLKDADDLTRGPEALPLAAINDQNPDGAKLLAGAKRLLAGLGKADATTITLTDVADTARVFAQTKFNGDGIIPPDSAPDAATQKTIEDILACVGGEADRSGKQGVSQAKLDEFFAQAQAYCDWRAKADSDKAILPLGDATGVALDAVKAVRTKVDDYFARCCVAVFDARAAAPMNRAEAEYVAMAVKDLTLSSEEISRLPLARVEPGRSLPLTEGINPAWALAVESLRRAAVTPLLGNRSSISQADWATLQAALAPYEAWCGAKAGTAVEKLGLERVRAILDGPDRSTVADLIRQDAALESEYAQIGAVGKLIRYHRDLNRLVHNYVNLSDFYDPNQRPIFQIGRLYMDGRACDLCFDIEDMGKHAMFAAAGRIYLAYCEITRKATGQKKTICAAFTAGFAETLSVGRNGLFYDRQGNDWDAVIVKVVESPISLKEAFWAPWKKIAAMISDQVKKLLAAREAAAQAAAAKGIEGAAKGAEAGKAPASPLPKADGAAVASSVAAIGIAVGLLGSAAAGLVGLASGLPPWKTALGVVAVFLAVSGPSAALAYFKLRARDLAPILNACGWAVNSRICMTLSLGRKLTREAKLPAGAERQLTDPYADSNARRNSVITVIIILAALYGLWWLDVFDSYLPDRLRHSSPPVATPSAPPAEPAKTE